MGTGTVAASLGGLGLFLLGSWLAGSGLGLSLSGPLRDRGARWTRHARGALLTGLWVTVAFGWSGSFALTAPALARRWRLPPLRRALLLAGSALSLGALALVVWVDAVGYGVGALALVAIGVGALLRVARPRHAVLGEGLAGHGLALLGIGLVARGLNELAGGLHLPGAGGTPIAAACYLLLGAGLGVGLRSPAAVLVLGLQAAASGLTDLFAAAALIAGSGVALGLITLRAGREGDADDGASAAQQGLLGGALALFLGIYVFLGLYSPLLLTGIPGGSYAALVCLFVVGLTAAVLVSVALAEPLQGMVRHRLNATRPATRGSYTPSPLEQSVPALLVEGLAGSVDTALGEARKLAQARLHGGRLSSARMEEARALTDEVTARLRAVGSELSAVRWTGPELAQALGAVRAGEASRRLIDQLGLLPERQLSEAQESGLARELSLAMARLWSLIEAATRGEEVPLMEDFRELRDLLDQELVQLHAHALASWQAAAAQGYAEAEGGAVERVALLRAMVHTTCELADARSLEATFDAPAPNFEPQPEAESEGEEPGAALPARRPVRIRGAA